MYKRGTIVLVPFPFTDLTSMKVRPALIVGNDKLRTDDVLVIFISALMPRFVSATDYLLRRDSRDFAATGLHANSIFKTMYQVAQATATTVYVVGGYVRDQLLGLENGKEIDAVVVSGAGGNTGGGIAFAQAFDRALHQQGSLVEFD